MVYSAWMLNYAAPDKFKQLMKDFRPIQTSPGYYQCTRYLTKQQIYHARLLDRPLATPLGLWTLGLESYPHAPLDFGEDYSGPDPDHVYRDLVYLPNGITPQDYMEYRNPSLEKQGLKFDWHYVRFIPTQNRKLVENFFANMCSFYVHHFAPKYQQVRCAGCMTDECMVYKDCYQSINPDVAIRSWYCIYCGDYYELTGGDPIFDAKAPLAFAPVPLAGSRIVQCEECCDWIRARGKRRIIDCVKWVEKVTHCASCKKQKDVHFVMEECPRIALEVVDTSSYSPNTVRTDP